MIHLYFFDPLDLFLVEFRKECSALFRIRQDIFQLVVKGILGVVAGACLRAHACSIGPRSPLAKLLARNYLLYVFLTGELAEQKWRHFIKLLELAQVEGLSLIFFGVAFWNIKFNLFGRLTWASWRY